ncbi:MAG: hypothetical protein IH623_13875 [Verrucomicrobia bacterium]|nr:hypothetical protein [Verrucomicrobiota bacterium]
MLIGLAVVSLYRACNLSRSFDNLERNAKKVISGDELQSWAARLLEEPPANANRRVTDPGVNFPMQMLGLYQQPPTITIQESNLHSPASILLSWGSGMMGSCGFEIGPTNYISYRPNARAWQPGVYFWSNEPQ